MIISYDTRRKERKALSKCNFCGKKWKTDTEQSPYVCINCEHKNKSLQRQWKKRGLI